MKASSALLFELFVRQCWQIAAVALVLGALATLVRQRRPHLAYALWGLVLVKALTPPVWHSPVSALGWAESAWQARRAGPMAVMAPSEAADSGFAARDPAAAPRMLELPASTAAGTSGPISRPAPRSETAGSRLLQLILCLWWLGVAATVALVGAACWRIRRQLQPSADVPTELVRLAEKTARRLGLARVPAIILTESFGPAVCGVIRPKILLPASLSRDSSAAQLAMVLAHELVHVRRRDLWVAWLQTAAQCVWWFHPLVWWASRAMSRERERCCDFEVVASGLCDRAEYAQCLVATARFHMRVRLGLVPVGLTALELTRQRLEEIMRMVSGDGRRARRIGLAIVLLVGPVVLPSGAWLVPAARQDSLTAGVTEVRPKSNTKDQKDGIRTMRINVLGPDGKPLPGAKIHVTSSTTELDVTNRDYLSNEQGEAEVEVHQSPRHVDLWVTKESHVGLTATWQSQQRPDKQWVFAVIPQKVTFRLQKGTHIGGVVRNEDGEPIAGAKVQVKLEAPDGVWERLVKPNPWLSEGDEARVTDRDGRWSLDSAPAGDDFDLQVLVSHPDYISDYSWGEMQTKQGVTSESFRDRTGTIVMRRGISVTGVVTAADGKGIPEAVVVWGTTEPWFTAGSQEVRTDPHGNYRLAPLPPGPIRVTVVAQGWAPDQKTVKLAPGNSTLDFRLDLGKKTRIRFVDDAGRALPRVGVGIKQWRRTRALYNLKHAKLLDTKIPSLANENGVFEWNWAPHDAVEYDFFKKGYEEVENYSIVAGEKEHVVTLNPVAEVVETPPQPPDTKPSNAAPDVVENPQANAPRTMRIRVLVPDDKPVPSAGIRANITTTETIINRDYVTDARGEVPIELPDATTMMLRLWARTGRHVGMHAHWDAKWQPDGHLIPPEYTFRLEEGTRIGGIVTNEDGEPIRGAKVQVHLEPTFDSLQERSWPDLWIATGDKAVTTDAVGRWTLDHVAADDRFKVLLMLSHPEYISDTSWAAHLDIATQDLVAQTAKFTMHRGVSLSGFVLDDSGNKIPEAIVVWGANPSRNSQFIQHRVRTDDRGHFRLPPLPTGECAVTVTAASWSPAQKTIDLSPANSSIGFKLQGGKKTRIRFVDPVGSAIPDVHVSIGKWRDHQTLYDLEASTPFDPRVPTRADSNGVYEWSWAPADPIVYGFAKRGYAYHEQKVAAGDGEVVVTLQRERPSRDSGK
ncbi:MAG: carboxypeptidase regulatory-like domain-containing protein [Planctomycetaceae bacterium]